MYDLEHFLIAAVGSLVGWSSIFWEGWFQGGVVAMVFRGRERP